MDVKVKRTPSVKDAVTIERLNAELEKEKARSDYIVMMADIEIPVEESEGNLDE